MSSGRRWGRTIAIVIGGTVMVPIAYLIGVFLWLAIADCDYGQCINLGGWAAIIVYGLPLLVILLAFRLLHRVWS